VKLRVSDTLRDDDGVAYVVVDGVPVQLLGVDVPDVTLTASAGVFHLPGQHNQKDHGHESQTADITDEQFNALGGYQDDWSGGINTALRRGEPIDYYVKNIDAAIKTQPPLDHDVMVYRVVGEEVYRRMAHSRMFVDRGYVSTTSDFYTADDYRGEFIDYHKQDGHIVQIKIPAGRRVFDYESHPRFEDTQQHEVLIPRNAIFRVERRPNGLVLHLSPEP
jgi:ADP-ribosyltransferase exoenzyme